VETPWCGETVASTRPLGSASDGGTPSDSGSSVSGLGVVDGDGSWDSGVGNNALDLGYKSSCSGSCYVLLSDGLGNVEASLSVGTLVDVDENGNGVTGDALLLVSEVSGGGASKSHGSHGVESNINNASPGGDIELFLHGGVLDDLLVGLEPVGDSLAGAFVLLLTVKSDRDGSEELEGGSEGNCGGGSDFLGKREDWSGWDGS
jgi:hypothetical protein